MLDPFDSLASGPLADAVFNERRRFRVCWGTAKSETREMLGTLVDEVIEMGESGLEVRFVRPAEALVAVDVARSAI